MIPIASPFARAVFLRPSEARFGALTAATTASGSEMTVAVIAGADLSSRLRPEDVEWPFPRPCQLTVRLAVDRIPARHVVFERQRGRASCASETELVKHEVCAHHLFGSVDLRGTNSRDVVRRDSPSFEPLEPAADAPPFPAISPSLSNEHKSQTLWGWK